jgi:hypothetical protein
MAQSKLELCEQRIQKPLKPVDGPIRAPMENVQAMAAATEHGSTAVAA